MGRLKVTMLSLLLSVALIAPAAAQAPRDRHAGYYYPQPVSIEAYKARSQTLPDTNRRRRIGFIINIAGSMRARPYPPMFDIFPKGENAEKLIIVSNQAGRLDTIYRVRGLLATMTSVARTMPIFVKYHVETFFTFLDLLKMLGFKQITVSDGAAFAHQIKIK
jgi:hypothetical protein